MGACDGRGGTHCASAREELTRLTLKFCTGAGAEKYSNIYSFYYKPNSNNGITILGKKLAYYVDRMHHKEVDGSTHETCAF